MLYLCRNLAVLLIALFVPLLVWSTTVQQQHYKVAIDAEYAPYEFRDVNGQAAGMLPDLLRAMGQSAGIVFDFIPMTWPEAVAALQRGDVDIINMIRTPERMFEPFFTTKFTGRGLGMSAVLGIIHGHHGTLKVYSELEHGTAFKMLLPISTKSVNPPANSIDDTDSTWQGCGTILIVDDEEAIRESASMMLEAMGFTTRTAADGVEGVEIYRQFESEITVVLLDMTMPKLDGKGCFSQICHINPEAKVILSSGYSEQEVTNQFAGRKLAGFIQKPYLPERLKKVIKDAL